jgi:hypothetical protein
MGKHGYDTRHKGSTSTGAYETRGSKSGSNINYKETLTRPSGWMPHVEEAVCAAAEQKEENGVTLYKCGDEFYERKDMSIDHIVPWEKYVRKYADVTDRKSVVEVYNDTNNLRLISKIANSKKGNKTRVQW